MNDNQNVPKPNTSLPSMSTTIIALLLVYIVWGSTYLAIHYAVLTMPPFIMASLRYLIGGFLLYMWLRLRGVPNPNLSQWLGAAAIGAFLLGGGNGGVVWAQKTVPSGLTAILVSVIPLWMAVFESVLPNGKKPSFMTWLGLFLGFIGLLLLLNVKSHSFSLTPALLVLVMAPISWAFGSVLSRRIGLPPSPFMATAAQMITGGLLLGLMAIIGGEFNGFHYSEVSSTSWYGLIYLTFMGGLVGFTAYVWLLKNAPLPLVSTYAYVNPLVAVLLGWLFAHEIFTLRTAIAGSLILLSVAITGLTSKKA